MFEEGGDAVGNLIPVLAEPCGTKAPADLTGKSLRPLLNDPSATVKDAASTFVARGPGRFDRSLRAARWRFTRWSDGTQQLYDDDAGAEENYDVAKANSAIVEQLTIQLKIQALRPAR